jgi:hypothetical protein
VPAGGKKTPPSEAAAASHGHYFLWTSKPQNWFFLKIILEQWAFRSIGLKKIAQPEGVSTPEQKKDWLAGASGLAAALEVIQRLIPGRHSQFIDFSEFFRAGLGVLAVILIERLLLPNTVPRAALGAERRLDGVAVHRRRRRPAEPAVPSAQHLLTLLYAFETN